MATVDIKKKADDEGHRFRERWNLKYFFTENLNNCVCLICQETVAMYEEFNVKRHHQTKDAKAQDKLSESDCAEKVKQLEAVSPSQQW